jgi:hypothetical protein
LSTFLSFTVVLLFDDFVIVEITEALDLTIVFIKFDLVDFITAFFDNELIFFFKLLLIRTGSSTGGGIRPCKIAASRTGA